MLFSITYKGRWIKNEECICIPIMHIIIFSIHNVDETWPHHLREKLNIHKKNIYTISLKKYDIINEGQVIEKWWKQPHACLYFYFFYFFFSILASIWVHHPLIIAKNKNKQVWSHFRNQSTEANNFCLSNCPFSFINPFFQLKYKVLFLAFKYYYIM
jgi:hypothetical protein